MARSSVSLGRVISRAAIAARASPPSLFKQSLTIRSGLNNDLSQWDKSRVWKQLSGFLPPGKHLTGDTGYKIWGHMLAPFPEAEALQDSRKRLYNYLHPKTRIVVECAFEERKFMVRLTGYNTKHNHRVDRVVCENHPSVRRVEDPMTLAFADVMQSSGSKQKRITQFLRDKTVMALHVANNHWYGIVFDFRAGSRGITVFDPLQHQNSKYYGMCDTLLKNLFGEMCDLMRIKKESKTRQPDVASCGVMVLTFFECFIQGMVIPSKPSPTLLRFLRLRYLLKCLH
ncbi:hypothetical protein PI125_g20870 [Phytophthora idaei]|nr:hypothetical protein PI125_g20870 [Phytophthora idaei]